ncbi:MAG TPA: hypothetical protein VM120_01505 [Bryobacteraceae bacterium]|nr:hypothetical protein [Bryobacteraceae bacterium]
MAESAKQRSNGQPRHLQLQHIENVERDALRRINKAISECTGPRFMGHIPVLRRERLLEHVRDGAFDIARSILRYGTPEEIRAVATIVPAFITDRALCDAKGNFRFAQEEVVPLQEAIHDGVLAAVGESELAQRAIPDFRNLMDCVKAVLPEGPRTSFDAQRTRILGEVGEQPSGRDFEDAIVKIYDLAAQGIIKLERPQPNVLRCLKMITDEFAAVASNLESITDPAQFKVRLQMRQAKWQGNLLLSTLPSPEASANTSAGNAVLEVKASENTSINPADALQKQYSHTGRRIGIFLLAAKGVAQQRVRINKTHFWKAVGYTSATEFEAFQREDPNPKKNTSAAKKAFEHLLALSPLEFIALLDSKKLLEK